MDNDEPATGLRYLQITSPKPLTEKEIKEVIQSDFPFITQTYPYQGSRAVTDILVVPPEKVEGLEKDPSTISALFISYRAVLTYNQFEKRHPRLTYVDEEGSFPVIVEDTGKWVTMLMPPYFITHFYPAIRPFLGKCYLEESSTTDLLFLIMKRKQIRMTYQHEGIIWRMLYIFTPGNHRVLFFHEGVPGDPSHLHGYPLSSDAFKKGLSSLSDKAATKEKKKEEEEQDLLNQFTMECVEASVTPN